MGEVDIKIYCDGSSGKMGSAGWGIVIITNLEERHYYGGVPRHATNQVAELRAAIEALRQIKPKRRGKWKIEIRSDSAYLVNCFRDGWIANWRRKNWLVKGKERPNRAWWETLEALVVLHEVEFIHVKGHAGDHYNEICDKLAVGGRKRCEAGGGGFLPTVRALPSDGPQPKRRRAGGSPRRS